MIYFKASTVNHKPFIQWDSVAYCVKELHDLGLDNDPLVLAEDQIPDFIFGVSPLQIIDGELHQVSCEQMYIYENEYNESELQIRLDKLLTEICALCCKIEVLKSMGEPYEILQNQYNVKVTEYQFMKNKEQVLPLNF